MKSFWIAAAAVLLAPCAASAADLTGTWKLDLDIADMKFHAVCQMAQMDMGLTGTCTGSEADAKPVALTGTNDGTTVKFAYDVDYQGNPLHLTYTGKLTSDTAMGGAVDAQIAQGTFTGAKQ